MAHNGSEGSKGLSRRFGTMMSKRRQSIHGGFQRAPSPSKGFIPSFGSRNTVSRDGRPSPSPRTSSNNLRESPAPDNRLSSLAESPPAMSPTSPNGTHVNTSHLASAMNGTTTNGTAASHADLSDVQPPPGPPPSHMRALAENQTDSEGYTVPAAMNDPISLAQQEIAQETEQPQFKLDIKKEPIPEQDADAQAALSSVANTLRSSQLATPNRKAGTIRGRRDVRNTVYIPSANSLHVSTPDGAVPLSPGIPAGRAAALAALTTGDASAPSVSDTTSIRSGHSLVTAHSMVKHPDMHHPGLNASIIETVSATLVDGVLTTAGITGEVALVHHKAEDEVVSPDSKLILCMAQRRFTDRVQDETIRINNFPNLEVIGPNLTFTRQASADKPDEFTVNLAPISSKPQVAFSYRAHVDDTTIPQQGPLMIQVGWKTKDADKLVVVVYYHLNPAYGEASMVINNLVLAVTYGGAPGINCKPLPQGGIHAKDRSLVFWRLGDVTLGAEPQRCMAQITGAGGVAPEAGHVEAKWEINSTALSLVGSGITLSRLELGKGKGKEESEDDPFADEDRPVTPLGNWVDIDTHKKFVSGKYQAR